MTCHLYQEDLSTYLDGELPTARAARLEAHLRVCPHCLGEYNELTGISRYIHSATRELAVGPQFDQRVLRAVGYYHLAARPVRPRSYLRPLVATAVALLALLGAAEYFHYGRPPSLSLTGAQGSAAAVAPVLTGIGSRK